ncbi:carbohydrate-binding module family 1 protein [Hypoxylon fuscum]|nr:carbohydrate-binding module family 1 protein [Hypoxylon fuscum]
MGRFGPIGALLLAVSLNVQQCLGQSGTPTLYTDSNTGIIFDTWTVPDKADGGSGVSATGGLTFGVALPENALTVDATEFIGYLKCGSNGTTTNAWCGLSFGGPMTNSLLLMAWPYEDQTLTSFRFASGYTSPDVYTGDAKLTQISSTIDESHFTLIFRCQNCLAWDQGGATGSASTSAGLLVLGWASSLQSPSNPSCPADISINFHSNGQSIWPATLDGNAANPSYTKWAAQATATVTGSCGGTTPTTTSSMSSTAAPTATGVPVPTGSYDYIVVGAGAGGIPLADKLSEAGKSVLLIEKGPPSSGRWGGTLKPEWLDGTNLTRFDVPGLCNEIWVNSAGIACTDTDQMAGCVLGGGTAVNAGLWWKPYTLDWDYNFPKGWKSSDMAAATKRVFSRIPGTDHPSMDGKRYYQQGFEVLAGGLKSAGWAEVTANDVPNQKNHTFSHSPFMFSGGERGGPMSTYLVSANKRKNFHLWMGTAVKRVIRNGGHVTGIEVEPFINGGYTGVVNITSVTGRVILSAGTFGSAKILLRSGIGPTDQLAVVKSSADGPTMISNSSWVNLPVGYNLEDHTNTDIVIEHPDVVFYDFYEAWDTPNVTDKDQYLSSRSGILAQAAPNIGPMFWDEIKGDDGVVRQLQWTARVEGSDGTPNGYAMTMSQYLGRGAKSRGRMTITKALTTVVSTLPYLQDKNDVQAVIQGIKNLQAALANVKGLTWTYPTSNTTAEDFVNNMLVSYTNRRSNHWIGTSKLGTDDGRTNSGSAVVDLDTRVYGTDNLFVVDASIFPGHITTNPSSYIVIAAEHASQRILALAAPKAQGRYAQCGGLQWTGSFQCATPYACKYQNDYYSQVSMQ